MKRIKRGKYQIVKPEEFVKKIIKDNLEKENILKKSNKKYAFTNSTAVNIWTDGYYWTDFTKGFKPIHINIFKKDIKYWQNFFKENDTEYNLSYENKTLFGLTYIVHPKEKFNIETKDRTPVVPLKETIEFCKKNIFTYRPVLEYLYKKYNLNIFDNFKFNF